MPGFTKSFLFPDINVWVALTHAGHVHHFVASDWFADLDADMRFGFCRFTQLGLLRLLTAEAVMGTEPPGLEGRFRALTRSRHASPKAWADAYLAAFAEASQITLVTLDRAFRGKARPLVLLEL